MTRPTIPACLLAAALLLLAACGDVPSPTVTAPAETARTVTLDAGRRRARTDAAVTLEHGLHDWGADPALADRTGPQTASILDEARTPDAIDDPGLGVGAGPNAAGPECEAFPDGDECAAVPTNLAHLRANQWTVGARLADDPTVALQSDGSAVVTGRVRVILWSGVGTDSDRAGDGTRWWRFRPATAVFAFRDRLEFDGTDAVTARRVVVRPDSWLASPFDADDWTCDVTEGFSDAVFADIPVEGDMPEPALTRDAGVAVLTPDMGWTDEWTAFMASHGTDLRTPDGQATQNP